MGYLQKTILEKKRIGRNEHDRGADVSPLLLACSFFYKKAAASDLFLLKSLERYAKIFSQANEKIT